MWKKKSGKFQLLRREKLNGIDRLSAILEYLGKYREAWTNMLEKIKNKYIDD